MIYPINKAKLIAQNMSVIVERNIYQGINVFTVIKTEDAISKVIFKTRITDQELIDGISINGIIVDYFNGAIISLDEALSKNVKRYLLENLKRDYQIKCVNVLDAQCDDENTIALHKFRVSFPVYETKYENIYKLLVEKLDIPIGAYVFDYSLNFPCVEYIPSIERAILTIYIQAEWREPITL